MRYKFVTIGGQGSRYLINKLSTKYVVGDKPDGVFEPLFERIAAPIQMKISMLNWIRVNLFQQRSNGQWTINNLYSLCDIFPRYIELLDSNDNYVGVFNYAFREKLFSRNNVTDTIFLCRNPVKGYSSFVKPERHKILADYLGGINSKEAIEYFCMRWNDLVNEFFLLRKKSLNAHMVFYEEGWSTMPNDVSQVIDLSDFKPENNSITNLDPNSISLINTLTFQNFTSLKSMNNE